MKNFVIVGLGNPGDEYRWTRHNAGFIFIDYFFKKQSLPEFCLWKDRVAYTCGAISDFKIYLVKPVMYMNRSGEALKSFFSFKNILPSDMIVCYDDIALPFGKIRIRKKGSHGGHNGMKSIIKNFATDEIKRMRIGINDENNKKDIKDFVLSNFSKTEQENLPSIMELCNKAMNEIIENGIDCAMNKFNL